MIHVTLRSPTAAVAVLECDRCAEIGGVAWYGSPESILRYGVAGLRAGGRSAGWRAEAGDLCPRCAGLAGRQAV